MIEENLEAWPLDVNECYKKLWVKRKRFKSKYLFPSHFVLSNLHVDFRLYGENDVSTLREYWVLTMHTIVTIGHIFNWGAILSSCLEQASITIHNTI